LEKTSRVDQDYRLVNLLVIASQVLGRIRKSELAPHDITPEASRVMMSIQNLGDKATSAEISRYIFREPNSVSEILSRMQSKGLIIRKKPSKGKTQIIGLTEKGKQTLEDISKAKEASLGYVIAFMSDEEELKMISELEELVNRSFQKLGMSRIPRISWP